MIPMNKDDVNRKYSPTWVYCNDNSRSSHYREKFTEQYGGNFVKKDRNYFTWEEEKKPVAIRRKFIFEDRDGVTYVIDNMYEFCNANDLTRPAMYEMMTGKRKSHKGFKFIAEIPWVRPESE
jgi:hypothetical protein